MNSTNDKDNKRGSSAEHVESTMRTYDRELHRFLLARLGGHRELSEDIRQEIYLRMLRFTDAELVREPRAYLYRIARNVLHDKLFLVERERATFTSSDEIPEGIAEAHAEQVDFQRDLQRILARLPPMHRTVLLMRATEGLRPSEIAEKLNLSEHTVKKYLHLALVGARLISVGLK